jgi:hypothetical protein
MSIGVWRPGHGQQVKKKRSGRYRRTCPQSTNQGQARIAHQQLSLRTFLHRPKDRGERRGRAFGHRRPLQTPLSEYFSVDGGERSEISTRTGNFFTPALTHQPECPSAASSPEKRKSEWNYFYYKCSKEKLEGTR